MRCAISDLWEALRERLDYARFVPRLIPDYERFEYRTRTGEPRVMVKNPHGDGGAGTYLMLDAAEAELLARMDGTKSVQEIIVEHLLEKGVFALDRLGRLTAILAANGFFGSERVNVYQRFLRRRALRRPIARMQRWLRRLIVWHIAAWSNADGIARALYASGGRLLFTRAGAAALAALVVVGLWSWQQEIGRQRHDLFRIEGSYTLGLIALIVVQVVGLTAHELGHALAIRHFGRRVRRLGFVLYYLMPCAYVDSTDMVMTSRGARILVSAAGAIAGLSLAAVAGLVAEAAPAGSLVGSLAVKAATVWVFQNLVQLLPILELDGYYILVDALDVPLLRQRAMNYARTRLLKRLRATKRLSREEIGLAAYGVLAIATSLAMLLFSLWIWQSRIHLIVAELWSSGPIGQLGTLLIAIVFLGPALLGLAAQLASWGGSLRHAFESRARRERWRELGERARLLARTVFFRDLRVPELQALASHLSESRVEAGTAIVREGEVGDRFYIIAEGEAEVTQGPEERRLNELAPGDAFGEIALLEDVPRTASVRARTAMRLFALDRAHFHRWASERVAAMARLRADLEEREKLARMPVFAALSSSQLDRLITRLRIRRVPAGLAVFEQGDPGDRFYVVAEGEAEVVLDGTVVRGYGPGGFFGELALLTRKPRSATVRALSDLVLYSLAPADLNALLRASADRAWLNEQLSAYVQQPIATAQGA